MNNTEQSYFQHLIAKRRSVRSYLDQQVGREDILSCVDAARIAPSACNVQPWRFVVVDDPGIKKRLCEIGFGGVVPLNKFAGEAPVIVVVVAERDIITDRIAAGIKGIPYYMLDIGAAIEQFLLRAAEMGLGTCWLGWFNEKPIKQLLDIPSSKKIVSLITIGYPRKSLDEPAGKIRKDIQEITSFNKYSRE